MSWRRVILALAALLAVLVVLGIGLGLRIATNAGAFDELSETGTDQCRVLAGVTGAEDIAVDRATGWAFVSATDRRAVMAGEPVRGDIFALRVDAPDAGFTVLTQEAPADFRPHGISLLSNADGVVTHLFAVSHPQGGGHVVEIFAVESGETPMLRHQRSVRDPFIRTPNDVVAVGPEAFYITNDHRYADGPMRVLEELLQWDATDVVYFDGEAARIAARDLTYANGIALSPDGAMLYVAELGDGVVRVYDRNAETGALFPRGEALEDQRPGIIPIGTGIDNIDVDAQGALWIAAHPRLLDFLAHAADADNLSPTRVTRTVMDPQTGQGRTEEIYLDFGDQISGGSVAVAHDGRLLIGSVFEPKIVLCDL